MLVSAIFGGTAERAVRRAFEEEVWASTKTRRELEACGDKLRARLTVPQMLRWNAYFFPLIGKMRFARVRKRLGLSRDPADDAYLSLAAGVHADFLVTGDKDLLSLSSEDLRAAGLARLSIVTPREFLERVRER